jgi:hypothetical protein
MKNNRKIYELEELYQIQKGLCKKLSSIMIQEYYGTVAYDYFSEVLDNLQMQINKLQRKANQKFILYEIIDTNIGSWNGKFSGEKERFTKYYKLSKNIYVPKKSSYHYNFGDGWTLNINVSIVSTIEIEKLKDNGFRNYEWMIESIRKNEKIINGNKQ